MRYLSPQNKIFHKKAGNVMRDASKEALENDEKAVEQIGKAFKEAITPILEEVVEKIKKQKSEVANYDTGTD